MAQQIIPFKFEGEEEAVRVVMKDGEPWFVATDLCRVLGLSSVTKSVESIPEEEKGVNPIHTPGGLQQVVVLTEAGMWHLVMRSDKPKAAELRRWLAKEVLPSIRKTGTYFAGVSPESLKSWRVQHAIQLVHLAAEVEVAQEKLNEHTRQLVAHSQDIKTLKETTGVMQDYVTIKGAAKKLGVNIDGTLGSMMGTVAAKRTRAAGLLVRDVPDTQYGSLHAYPREIAEESVKFVLLNQPQVKRRRLKIVDVASDNDKDTDKNPRDVN